MSSTPSPIPFDFKTAVASNRLLGLWRMMSGFKVIYIVATLSLGVAAASKTATYLLLRYFVDDVLGAGAPGKPWP